MQEIEWSDVPGDWHAGAVGNHKHEYVVHNASNPVVSIRFVGNTKKFDDYGPTILVHAGVCRTHWMRNGATLYLVVQRGTDTITVAERVCQWHHHRGNRWPDESTIAAIVASS